jgi:hypothetical protein
MKHGALLMNVARGGVVVEADLVAALRDGRLAGAAVDVFDQEPPPADHPLLRMDNVIVTQHCASTALRIRRMACATGCPTFFGFPAASRSRSRTGFSNEVQETGLLAGKRERAEPSRIRRNAPRRNLFISIEEHK